jgi:hypothetical protein
VALDVEIRDMKLSLIWVETLPAMFDRPVNGPPPMPFLRSAGYYAEMFDRLLRVKVDPNGITLPWRNLKVQNFWLSYLEQQTRVSGSTAWRKLIPLRAKPPFKPQPTWLLPVPKPVTLEGYFYPFGIALVLNAQYKGSLSLAEAVDLGYRIRFGGRYDVAGPGHNLRNLSLQGVAEAGLRSLREAALGPQAVPGQPFDREPYSLVTIVRAAGNDVDLLPLDGKELHRALNALSNWPPNRRRASLTPLSKAKRLADSQASSNSVLFAVRRGQAIWSPHGFADDPRTRHSLSCYHRNLLFACLQIESLCGLASVAAEAVRRHEVNSVSTVFRACAHNAACALGIMYGGARKSTYSSSSIARHIDTNGRREDVELIRSEWVMDPQPFQSMRFS